ncbi:hypothetical protein BgiMline_032269 [Biomphalaria glabrata]|uniref:Uncharacterized protein LOC106079983 n=1 Tax=Biomphalaria glabrata TaxID=6526 RepID=A0A9U8EP24_BIOGL|nr:uncharacterized protein LOC106079983 [Biomphalaria glabrata]
MAKPLYANEFRVQVHTGRSRQRAWSESTCTSLLSYSESEDSLRIGSSVALGAMASRPLPEIPLERSSPKEYQNNIRRASVHRQEPLKIKEKKKSAAGSRRRTLILISIASIVFSLFCLGLLVATFIRHGILPWDKVMLQSSTQDSCLSCIKLLQSILQSQNQMKAQCSSNMSPTQTSSSTVNYAHSLCLPVEVENLDLSLLKVHVGKENFTAPLGGWYFIFLESQTAVAIDIKKQSSECTTQIASTQCKPCHSSKSDNSFTFCWADVVLLQEGDVLSTSSAITIQNNDHYHFHIISLHELDK